MINVISERINNNKPVLIAEIGVNYYDIAKKEGTSPMEAAKKMIKSAAMAGIHAVKFQSYKAETIAMRVSPAYWDLKEEPTTTQFELFKKFDSFGEAEYKELAQYAEKENIEFLSTPFDKESADYLYSMMNYYKISSSDLNNLGFLEYLSRKNKPIILSVGASNEDEIDKAVRVIREHNDKQLTLLHCVLEYPTPYEHANLLKIDSLKRQYPDCIVGYSDHTKPTEGYNILRQAYCYGAKIIEKHFTLDKTLKGNDHYHAMDVEDAKNIIQMMQEIDLWAGDGVLKCIETEMSARKNARRSLVAAKDMVAGTVLTEELITWKRPGTGITADRIKDLIGKMIIKDKKRDEMFVDSDFE